jgi:hypothetical protein
VLGNGERGGREAVYSVTRSTLAFIGPLGKLAIVGVEVTIGACLKDEFLLEISIHVTLRAIEPLVFPEQGESGLRMIEATAEHGLRH